ncbi:MAG: cytochrome P450, partial [Acidimicrobiia bacterium]|nr:cytochrome P450 [Acidimicrobiia bacterium]
MEPNQTLAVDDIDLSDLTFWGRPLEEREGAFKTLRQQRPVAYMPAPDIQLPSTIELPELTGYYAVTRHADVLEASRQPELFCSGKGATSQLDMPEVFLEFFGSMINLDDPRHARLGRIVSAAFTPKMIKQFEHQVQVAADDIVDTVIDRGECDFVTEVAARLPLKIICDMMGIPESDYDFVFARSNVILGATDPEYVPKGGDIAVALLTAGAELAQLVTELGQQRKTNPTDDLTSALLNANVDGEHLTDSELASFFILLVVAGNETTRNAISHGMKLLTDHPDQRKTWMEDFDAVTPTAVEEIVRVASPVIFMRRTATQDTTL